jgi:6-phosphogluconolactonase (cycloisomerase 2 family)
MKVNKWVNIILCLFAFGGIARAQQVLSPSVVFKEDPRSHNMHITSDGKFLYTCNGGRAELGQVNKLKRDGTLVAVFPVKLDMRSIMYNTSDKKLYVYTYNKKLYRIDDLTQGTYTEVWSFPERSEQAAPALSSNGKLICFMEFGDVFVYNLKSGKPETTLHGLKCADNAADGGTAIAMDKKHLYTWDAREQVVYVYDLKGKFEKSLKLNQGFYGFSLSWANGLLWVSADGNYETGTWYGYEVK